MQCFLGNSRQIEGDRLCLHIQTKTGKVGKSGRKALAGKRFRPFHGSENKSSRPMHGEIKCESQLTVDNLIIPEEF